MFRNRVARNIILNKTINKINEIIMKLRKLLCKWSIVDPLSKKNKLKSNHLATI